MHVQQRLYPQRLGPHGIITSDDLNKAQFMTSASSLPALLKPKYDIIIPLLLPCDFAVYANDLASRAQASAGLRETKLLMPAVPGYNFLGRSPVMEGLFYWRIGAELMWQQLDRRIDECVSHLMINMYSHFLQTFRGITRLPQGQSSPSRLRGSATRQACC
jgi:hypothetical protein